MLFADLVVCAHAAKEATEEIEKGAKEAAKDIEKEAERAAEDIKDAS